MSSYSLRARPLPFAPHASEDDYRYATCCTPFALSAIAVQRTRSASASVSTPPKRFPRCSWSCSRYLVLLYKNYTCCHFCHLDLLPAAHTIIVISLRPFRNVTKYYLRSGIVDAHRAVIRTKVATEATSVLLGTRSVLEQRSRLVNQVEALFSGCPSRVESPSSWLELNESTQASSSRSPVSTTRKTVRRSVSTATTSSASSTIPRSIYPGH